MTDRQVVLWTGGFDSTYLVVDRLLAGDRVRAVRSGGWMNPVKAEREAIARVRIAAALPAELRARLDIVDEDHGGLVLAGFKVTYDELSNVSRAWTSQQNAALLLVAREVGPAAVGLVADDNTTRQIGVMTRLKAAGLSMPAAHLRKAQLWQDAQRRGFEHLLAMTWSCEEVGSLDDAPCGLCDPCKGRIVAQAVPAGA